MTPAQKRVFESIRNLLKKGVSPSFEEIGKSCGLRGLATVSKHVHALERDGYITRERQNRSIALCVDQVLAGYRCCNRGHEKIYFESLDCPLCNLILERAREVTVQ